MFHSEIDARLSEFKYRNEQTNLHAWKRTNQTKRKNWKCYVPVFKSRKEEHCACTT